MLSDGGILTQPKKNENQFFKNQRVIEKKSQNFENLDYIKPFLRDKYIEIPFCETKDHGFIDYLSIPLDILKPKLKSPLNEDEMFILSQVFRSLQYRLFKKHGIFFHKIKPEKFRNIGISIYGDPILYLLNDYRETFDINSDFLYKTFPNAFKNVSIAQETLIFFLHPNPKNCNKHFLNVYVGNVFNPILAHFRQNLQNVSKTFFGFRSVAFKRL